MTRRVIGYRGGMGRWDPDARGRLERAALELFAEQGFADTTVPQITERAGLTTRTFFRYFADKREVLFSGEEELRAGFTGIVRKAPADLSPLELLHHGLHEAATTLFQPLREHLRTWRSIVESDSALRERALRKQELTTEAVLAVLHERGTDGDTAEMIAKLSNLLLHTAVGRWVAEPEEDRPLAAFVEDVFDQLRSTVTGESSVGTTRAQR
jgi:AcrR family transcriptional regulator